MENASKALLMAAGVLLGVLLLSIMIYVFRQGSRVNQTYDQKQITNQLELYNSKFEYYDKDNNTVMDVISLVNLAFDINKDTNFDSSNVVQIEIEVGGKTFVLPNTDSITERNMILYGSTQMSVYDLASLPLHSSTTGEKHLGIYSSSIIDCAGHSETDDKLSTTKLKNGKTIYKFLFKVANPEDFEYHLENMKVSRIKLTAYYNKNEWEGITE